MVEGRSGKGSVAYNFNGLNNTQAVYKTSFLTDDTNNSICWWQKVIGNSSGINIGRIFDAGNYFVVYQNDEKMRFQLNATSYVSTPVYNLLNNWVHGCITYNDVTNNGTIYLNGVYQNSITIQSDISGSDFTIGNRLRTSGNRTFNGSISDVMIFNRTLSSDEIAQLYIGLLPMYSNSGYFETSDTPGDNNVYDVSLLNYAGNYFSFSSNNQPANYLTGGSLTGYHVIDANGAVTNRLYMSGYGYGTPYLWGGYNITSSDNEKNDACDGIFSYISNSFSLAAVALMILIVSLIISILSMTIIPDIKGTIVVFIVSSVTMLVGYILVTKIYLSICWL
jgi:hypothetical protein